MTARQESIAGTASRMPQLSSTATAEKLLVGDRKELRRRRRVGENLTRPPSPVVHVREYQKPSWLTSRGVNRKRKMIEAKGLPSMKNWRFITLTIDRKLYPDPLVAYLQGVDRLRRFMESCRKANLWKRKVKWAWKFEFQSDGYPHWHLCVGHRYKFTHKQLTKLGELWVMGRTSVQRIEDSAFGYSFKYAFKPALMPAEYGDEDEFERLAPDWFLDYVGTKTVKVKPGEVDSFEPFEAQKPCTFKRVRFWQTSKDFYTGAKRPAHPAKPQKSWGVPITVRHSLERESRTVQVFARTWSGKYVMAATVVLTICLQIFWGLVGFDTMHGGAVGLSVNSFVIPTHRITNNVNKTALWQIQQILVENQLKLKQAETLRNQGETLKRC